MDNYVNVVLFLPGQHITNLLITLAIRFTVYFNEQKPGFDTYLSGAAKSVVTHIFPTL